MDGRTPPTRADRRIDTLDVLRGIAICGILLMNIPGMGMIGQSELPPLPVRPDADWIAWGVQQLVFTGTMRGLFTMLFGAGMVLMLRRTFEGEDNGGRASGGTVAPIDVWTRRCFALMALGVVQWALFFWPGEILWNYGVVGFALLTFRTACPRTLLIAAGLALAGLCVWFAVDLGGNATAIEKAVPIAAARAAGRPLDDEQKKRVVPLDEAVKELHPSAADVAAEYRRRTHLPTLAAWSFADWKAYNLDIAMWETVLESLAFMLIGMALYRMGVLTGAASDATYARLMLIGYPAGLAVRGYFLWWRMRTGFELDPAGIDVLRSTIRGALFEPARLLVTLGHVGLIVSLYHRGALGRAWPLRALGRMALTVYCLESILTSLLFYALGYVGAFGFAALMGIAAIIWVACALFCMAWLSRYETGPAEQLLRAVAYARSPRLRRKAAAASAVSPAI